MSWALVKHEILTLFINFCAGLTVVSLLVFSLLLRFQLTAPKITL